MAAVYLGEHTTLKLPMAIKILHDHLSDTPDILSRFKAEAQSVAALRHPNIVQVFDFDMVDGRPYIAMEYVRGITFSTYLNDLHQRDLRLPIGMIAQLILALSSALDYAHERRIVHRDIKPANIILRQGKTPIRPGQPLPSDTEPILTDFGIARILDATTQTATGTILGTPAYMSPEQVNGTKVDHRTDIYSLGIILYEMLAGVPPFVSNSDTPVSILMKHLDEEPPDLDQVSPSVQTIVDKALEKDRQKRFQWAGALAKTLSNVVKPELTSILRSSKVAEQEAGGPPRGVAPKTQKQEKIGGQKWRLPRAVGLSALGIVGLVVVVAFVIFGGSAGDPVDQNPTHVPTSVIAAQAEASPTSPPIEPTAEIAPTSVSVIDDSEISGEMAFRDATFNATLIGLNPPPPAMVYRGWLVGELIEIVDGEEEVVEIVLDLTASDSVHFQDGAATINYSNPESTNLLARYHTVVLTLAPAEAEIDRPSGPVFELKLNRTNFAQARLIDEVNKGDPLTTNLLAWLSEQAQHLASHARNATNSIAANNIDGARSHSEHMINIIAGIEGELYGDYDEDGKMVNPGDEAGLLTYLRFIRYLFQQSIDSGLDGDGSAANIRDEISAFIDVVIDARETARQVAFADSLELIVNLGYDLEIEAVIGLGDQIRDMAQRAQGLDLSLHIQISPTQNQ